MKRVTLQFPDTKSLWAFAQLLTAEHIYINSTDLKITCNCTERDISKALIEYNAIIVDEVEKRKKDS